ncbi:carbon-nitrogen hydrolase family protein [Cyclobacterium qasimii]|uniref:CN hydrolase domain-containing protein n=2 Tax=Cyclobacterium qasimii TaxID=1350429 RepID=S7VDJ6_9BACT|nr:carbon-nitrogen hydrolase family protein [Cyclobacterium qasimii]EPR68305.1 hypothetical protein ADICYQ_2775 [Cyclobacterium qasimii M12-11B]GEO19861.1 hydrolase [Cyclobacterium qasimii]
MKIGLIQSQSHKGNIRHNIEQHKYWIDIAVAEKADLIVFPELSLTSYEPELAEKLALDQQNLGLSEFQQLSDRHQITIGIGLPTKSKSGIFISMVFFQPNLPYHIYSKQKLHPDEMPYFVAGDKMFVLTINDLKIAPAICYEGLQPEHAEKAMAYGADVYLASVAKPQQNVEKAFSHFSNIAVKYSIPVLMVNCIGHCDNFKSAGQTSIWDKNGLLIGQLDQSHEGILFYDTESQTSQQKHKGR